jgi:NADH-quinone oxidoreductase subunit N
MDYQSIAESLSYIKPEIAISASLALIVIFDLIFDKDKRIIPYVALLGIIVTGYFCIEQIGTTGSAFYESAASKNYGMMTIDPFGSFFKLLVLASSLIIVFFSLSSDEIKKTIDRSGEYFTLIFGMIAGMMFMISASDLILIYISMEIVSLSSFVLAGFTKLRNRNSEAALKYMIYGAASSGLMLFGISIVYGITGSTNLYMINSLIQGPQINPVTIALAIILIFAGIGYKISSVPFHFWTPDVYEGSPISITAFLSIASKAAGFAMLIRFIKTSFVLYVGDKGYWHLIEVFDWQSFLIIISLLTMTLGNFSALWQTNLKRMLAYSSIAHAGYIMLGLVVLSNQGLLAILVYFPIYALMNIGAFYIVMLIANKTGSEELEDYNGLGLTTPFLGVSLAIFLISLTGLPPTAGFIGKLYIFIALLDAKMIIVAVIALLNTVVSLYYYVRVLRHMFLTEKTSGTPTIPYSYGNIIFILILLIPILVLGIYFTPLVEFSKNCLTLLGI